MESRFVRALTGGCALIVGLAGIGAAGAQLSHRSRLVVHSTLGAGVTAPTPVTATAGNAPVVATATTPTALGWWEATASGAVDTYGDAPFAGALTVTPNKPIVGMAATPDGRGYWLVATDGGIFSFGDAAFHGSTGAIALNKPIVGMAPTPDGLGYWLVASDGGIFSFGDARFYGSTGAMVLNKPIVGMGSTPDGGGYWLVATDGGIFAFGNARFFGSTGAMALGSPVVGLTATPDGGGYWEDTADGRALRFGDAPDVGSASLSAPVTAAALQRKGPGVRLVAADGSSAGLNPGSSAVISGATPTGAPGSPSSYTYLVTNTDGSPARFNPCAAVHYVTNLADAPAGAASLVDGALARISAATGVTFVDDGSTTEVPSAERAAYQPDRYGSRWAPVLVAWSRASESDLLPGGNVIGEGGSAWVEPAGGSKAYVTGQAVIDADNTGNLSPSFGGGSTLGELLMHELGHVIGLGHTNDSTQIMYATLLPVQSASYGAGDLTGLSHLGTGAGCINIPNP